MFKGFYNAASSMIAFQRQQEMLTNNLANANTPGYKSDQASLRSFPEMLLNQMNGTGFLQNNVPSKKQIGSISTGIYTQDILPLFTQGDLKETSRFTDVAIVHGNLPRNENGIAPSLFFTVENGDGEVRFTRDGSFSVDDAGFLVISSGQFVLNTDGSRINVGANEFKVGDQGQISMNGSVITSLGVAVITEPNSLTKEGNGLFRLEEGTPFQQAVVNEEMVFSVKQGFIERSNVNVEQTMVSMMNAFRSFEANQKVLQAYDQSMEKAVNEVGKIG